MQLENYFDFLADDDIRIKGTRIGIESILYEYVHRRQRPEAIAERFHTVSLTTKTFREIDMRVFRVNMAVEEL